jgi:outer membrane protein OmpA-like peptidoglycan-associated protein
VAHRVNGRSATDPHAICPKVCPIGQSGGAGPGQTSRMSGSTCFEMPVQRRPPAPGRPLAALPSRDPSTSLGPNARAAPHADSPAFDQAAVLNLQRLAGNRAVTTLLDVQRQTAPPACGTYEPGERAKSMSAGGVLGLDVTLAAQHSISSAHPDSVVIADFPVGSAKLRSSTVNELRASWIGILERQEKATYEILGFSDCVGDGLENAFLRYDRARAVAALFPKTAARASNVAAGQMGEHLVGNATADERAVNRSVIIRLPPAAKPPPRHRVPKDPHVMVPLKEPPSENCSQAQKDQLAIAWPAAKLMAQKAIEWAVAGKSSVHSHLLERYFGPDATTNIVGIRAGYQKILSKWEDWDPEFECHAQTEGSCKNKDPHLITLAYVKTKGRGPFNRAYGNVHVCAASFNSINDMQKISATVLHELSHRLDGTDDHAYCKNPPQCNLSTEKALDNADAYAEFARVAFNASM